jgi:nucleotide-binding universal stress UspA family protein
MFNPILVPLDGSQLAECVIPHVAAMARSFEAEITLLRMLEKNQNGTPAQLFDLLNWQINKTKAALYLEKTKARMQESGLRVRTVVLDGLVAEGITDYAQKQGMKLIILSSHGHSGLTQWGISSIAQKIILSAPTSLLIVRAQQGGDRPGELSEAPVYQHILVPLVPSEQKTCCQSLPNLLIFINPRSISCKLWRRLKWRVKCRRLLKMLTWQPRW